MSLTRSDDNAIRFHSQRTHRGAPAARFRASYQPTGPEYQAQEGQLDHWLTARYCLYSADRHRQVWRGDIDHQPWQLQQATAEFEEESMVAPLGITRADCQPLLHFVKKLDVVAWTLEAVSG